MKNLFHLNVCLYHHLHFSPADEVRAIAITSVGIYYVCRYGCVYNVFRVFSQNIYAILLNVCTCIGHICHDLQNNYFIDYFETHNKTKQRFRKKFSFLITCFPFDCSKDTFNRCFVLFDCFLAMFSWFKITIAAILNYTSTHFPLWHNNGYNTVEYALVGHIHLRTVLTMISSIKPFFY